mgnify:CR=1 FL=1
MPRVSYANPDAGEALDLADRVRELEAALRPFADSYRDVRHGPLGKHMQEQYFASMTVSKFTVQDLARAADLIPAKA